MTTNQILTGVGLVFALAVGSQVLASRLRFPAMLLADTVGERVYRLAPAGADLLFVVRADGQLVAVTQTGTPTPQPGDTLVSLGPALAAPSADPGRSELPEIERR